MGCRSPDVQRSPERRFSMGRRWGSDAGPVGISTICALGGAAAAMATDFERFQIPAEFVDYRRRLIGYSKAGSESERLLLEFERLFFSLKKFGADDKKMTLEIGRIAAQVFYLRDQRYEVGEVI